MFCASFFTIIERPTVSMLSSSDANPQTYPLTYEQVFRQDRCPGLLPANTRQAPAPRLRKRHSKHFAAKALMATPASPVPFRLKTNEERELLGLLEPMNRHDEAILAFQEGRAAEALRLLEELLAAQETSELWNDWAAVQLGAGRVEQSETGLTRALQLDSQNTEAAANLGLLLLGRGDRTRAVPLLKQALSSLPTERQTIVKALLA